MIGAYLPRGYRRTLGINVAPGDYTILNTIVDSTLVCTDSSMGTMVRLNGLRTMQALSDFDGFLLKLGKKLSASLSRPGHSIQFWFRRDPSHARNAARELIMPQRNAAQYYGLDFSKALDIKEDLLARRIIPEEGYMIFWTRPSVLDPSELKKLEQDVSAPPAWPGAEEAQYIFSFAERLRVAHESWASDIIQTLVGADIGVGVTKMNGHQIENAILSSIRPSYRNSLRKDWLPTDRVNPQQKPVRLRAEAPMSKSTAEDISGILWPKMEDRLFDGQDIEVLGGDKVRLGQTLWSAKQMMVGPQDQQPFSELIRRVRANAEIPWSVSLVIESTVLPRLWFKRIAAKVSGITSQHSQLLNEAFAEADAVVKSGRPIVGIQAIFATWASVAEDQRNPGILEERSNRLQRSVESWGYTEVNGGGDPVSMVMGSFLGLNPISPAARGFGSIEMALKFLPLDRDASAMETGAINFVTENSTVFPWDIGSRHQLFSSTAIVAPPGSGKSSLISSIMMAYILSPSTQARMTDRRLPYWFMIDVGFSQYGNIATLRDALPPSRREEAQFHTLRNTEDFAINPFDTQPGFRKPIDVETSFLINFMTILVTPIGMNVAPPRLAELASAVITEAYRSLSDQYEDRGVPRVYVRGVDREVDAYIDKFGITVEDGKTAWWTVVDDLHRVGQAEATNAAILAQRNAVPRLDDLGKALSSNSITQEYSNLFMPGGGGERLLDSFRTALTFVGSEFKILSRPTRFRLGQGRVVVVDVGTIVSGTGPFADRVTTIVYMLTRSVGARNFYLSEDIMKMTSPLWKSYHEARIRQYRDAPKVLAYDELHKAEKSAVFVQQQLEADEREGRKWGVIPILASQSMNDFSDKLLDQITTLWIMGFNSDAAALDVAKRYNISLEGVSKIRDKLNGPTALGGPVMLLASMRDGKHEHFMYNVKSSYELWSDSTTPVDIQIRGRVAREAGYVQACMALAKVFPSGSAENELERLVAENPDINGLDVLAERAIEHHKRQLALA